ncbi:MAG: T9SS type A sorting domain-containing protein [Candidatus Cloacimonetes bacterium]|nr:T9SS type A sorting domain-containing protein [Candidatus Cloacimonadota bacterium]
MKCKLFANARKGILGLLLLCFCLHNISATTLYVVNSESRTLSKIDTDTDQVHNSFCQLGLIPNKVIIDNDLLWVVNSGDNSLRKISRQSGQNLGNILVAAACNPWDAVKDGNFIYVTGLFTNMVYKVDTLTNTNVASVAVGNSPEALCVYDGKLYVTNTGGWQNNYANSSVSVIELASFQVVQTIPVSANPQYITVHEGLLHVSCTGNWTSVLGAVCIINPMTQQVIQTINLGGSLGGIWIAPDNTALVGDGNGLNIYRYNAANYTILNDSTNPLSPGGSDVTGNSDLIALLQPNWGGSGKVRILHPDLSFWKEYNVGLAPTDIKLYTEPSALIDTSSPTLQTTVYPNPARADSKVTFQSSAISIGTIRIFNSKGQLVKSLPLHKGKAELDSREILSAYGSGCYLYQIKAPNSQYAGKLIILK